MSQSKDLRTAKTVAGSIEGRHGPIPVREYIPEDGVEGAEPLVWIHGGSFAWGGLDHRDSDAVARALASTGRRVLTVAYRLAPRFWPFWGKSDLSKPGHRFPVPRDDVVDAVTDYSARHEDRLYIGGASAGACLAAAAAIVLHECGRSPVCGQVLAYGIYHPELPPLPVDVRSRTSGRYRLVQFTAAITHRMNLNYAGSPEAMTRAFPGTGTLTGLPPALLVDADRDTLRASGELFAAQLAAAGVPVQHHVVRESMHDFLNHPGTGAFDEGIGVIERWLNREVRRGSHSRSSELKTTH